MGLFGKKRGGKKDAAAANKSQSAPIAIAPPPPRQVAKPTKVIKIVGDEKHVTTTSTDSQGRLVNQTVITKLTPTERLRHQQQTRPPSPSQQMMKSHHKSAPPQIYQPEPPPVQEQPPVSLIEQRKPPPQVSQQRMQIAAQGPPTPVPQQRMQPPARAPETSPQQTPSDALSFGAIPSSVVASNAGTSLASVPNQSEVSVTIEITRDLVKRFISDIWNRGEIELIPQVCHPSLRFNGHVGMDRVGHDGFARMVTTVRDALTDYHCEIHSMVVETNKAFCRLRFTGKHTGNLLGYPPTGRSVAWMGASEFTCKNGKILKVWELGDVKSLEEQLNSPN